MALFSVRPAALLVKPSTGTSIGQRSLRLQEKPQNKCITVMAATLPNSAMTVHRAAVNKDVGRSEAVEALEALEKAPVPVTEQDVQGKWQLVFSSAMPSFMAYIPVNENITISTRDNLIKLETDVLPFGLLTMGFQGSVSWEQDGKMKFMFEKMQNRSRLVQGVMEKPRKNPQPKTYTFFFLSEDKKVAAARSSAVGQVILRKVDAA
eukprot:jgi/Mesvir1/8182/Mv12481-RA.1